jgi:cytochrome c-type biogenesis protein CcmH
MTTFLILAAGLAALALLFILIPLLAPPPAAGIAPEQLNLALFRQQLAELDADLANGKLDQTRYEAARADLERAALHDLAPPSPAAAPGTHPAPAADDRQVRWVVRGIPLSPARLTNWGLGLGVPLLALGLYLGLGDAGMIGRMATAPQLAAVTGHGEGGSELPPLDVLVARLEQRMTEAPDDAQGWVMLGRTYFALRDAANAERALGRAYALTPRDPEVILAYAESIAANHDNDLTGRPAELVSEVLAMDREHVTARWLAGMAAFQRGQYQSAARAWQ